MRLSDEQARLQVASVEGLLERLSALPGPSRDLALDTVEALAGLYGEGLARLLDEGRHSASPDELERRVQEDELVSHLLLLHDLHPADTRARVEQALAEVRPYLASHGGDVTLLGIDRGSVRVRLEGSCKGCPSSAATLRVAVEEAVLSRAPEVERVEAERPDETVVAGDDGAFVPLAALRQGRREVAPSWSVVATLADLAPGEARVEAVDGEQILFLRSGPTLFAFRRRCPACATLLDAGALADGVLRCAGCDRRFDPARAGRAEDDAALQLEPVPLLADADGAVRVALGRAA